MTKNNTRAGGALIAGAVLLILAAVWGLIRLSGGETPIDGSTSGARTAFINSCGWETDATHCDLKEVRIPVEFDEVYEEYNKLQLQQGFDLRPYRAHSVKQYTYLIHNYRDEGSGTCLPDIYANLLVEDGRIIGADITSGEAGSFIAALRHSED